MISDCVQKVRAALVALPYRPTLDELAEASELSTRMTARAVDALESLGEVTSDRRYEKGRRGALPQVFALVGDAPKPLSEARSKRPAKARQPAPWREELDRLSRKIDDLRELVQKNGTNEPPCISP